jgi:hypothetical protein
MKPEDVLAHPVLVLTDVQCSACFSDSDWVPADGARYVPPSAAQRQEAERALAT